MKLSRANLAVRKVCGADRSDPVLHQVHIEPDGTTVASDGLALMAVEPVPDGITGTLPDFTDECGVRRGGVGVPPDLIDEAVKNLPKGNLAGELGFAVITKSPAEEDGRTGSIELSSTDLNKIRKVEGGISRGRFPEWRGVLRTAKRGVVKRVCVDRKALIRLLEAMDTACPDPENMAFIEFGEDDRGGILIRAASVETGQRAVGYVLPLDTGEEWLPMNAWEKRTFSGSAKVRKRK